MREETLSTSDVGRLNALSDALAHPGSGLFISFQQLSCQIPSEVHAYLLQFGSKIERDATR